MIRSSYSRVSGIAAGLVLALALTAAVSAQETLKLSQWLDFERVSGGQQWPNKPRRMRMRMSSNERAFPKRRPKA